MSLTRNIFGLSFLSCLLACSATTESKKTELISPDYATADIDMTTPEGTAYAMMIAMYRGDTELVDRVFLENGDLTRVKADGTVKYGGRKGWQDWVGALKVGQANEELFAIRTEQFGNLATVWAPFVISFNDKIVGCGVNQLSMAKSDGEWRIISGVDVQAPRDECSAFQKSYIREH